MVFFREIKNKKGQATFYTVLKIRMGKKQPVPFLIFKKGKKNFRKNKREGITMYLDEISPNHYNPIEGTKYMELKLRNE